jgi:hypothetical protein
MVGVDVTILDDDDCGHRISLVRNLDRGSTILTGTAAPQTAYQGAREMGEMGEMVGGVRSSERRIQSFLLHRFVLL